MNKAENEALERGDPKKKNLGRLIFNIVSILVLSGICVGIVFLSIYTRGIAFEGEGAYRVLSDAFAVSGLLGICFFLLTIASEHGTFDMLVYGVKKTFFLHIFKNYKKMVPATFAEYVAEKRGKQVPHYYWTLLIFSSALLLTGIVFLILFYSVYQG